ncbi:MAG: hypothetical protein RIR62_1653 [Pseudomonadota bacterium]|jgi:hypothetical protein
MLKICALSCVIGWSAFWAFSYLALTADPAAVAQSTVAALLAFGGLLVGTFSYIRLGRAQCIGRAN